MKWKVLIIDDNPADSSYLTRILKKIDNWKLEIFSANSSDEGFFLVNKEQPHIVFIDYLLGNETGIEVIKQIKKINNQAALILLTGYGSETVVTEALRAGSSDYLSKNELNKYSLDRTLRHIVNKLKTEEKLRQTESYLQRIIENTETGLFTLDRQFIIVDANDAFVRILKEKNKQELLGTNFIDKLEPEEAKRFKHTIQTGVEQNYFADLEVRIRNTEQKFLSLLINATAEKVDEKLQISALCRDITERKNNEQAYRESEASLKKAQKIARMGNWELNLQTEEIKCSEELFHILELTDLKKHTTVDEFLKMIASYPNYNRIKELIEAALHKKENRFDEIKIITTQNNEKYFRTDSQIIYNSHEQPIKIIGIIQDITAQKHTENALKEAKQKAEESVRLKNAFLANMSHEIRTPMNSILGFSELLSLEFSEEQKQGFIEQINKSGYDLLHVIDDIIDVAKIEAGEVLINKSECSLHKIFSELYDTFEGERKRKGQNNINITFKLSEKEENILLFTDGYRLKQILSNIISNALKFTETGTIEYGYTIKDECNLLLYVKDSGIGIPPEKINSIFDRFRKIDDNKKKLYRGAGLGLTIAKKLIRMLGGEIWVESKPGKGSCFYVAIPYKKNVEDSNCFPNNNFTTIQNWHNKTLLLLEPVDAQRMFIEAVLRDTQIKIIHANNVDDANALCKKHKNIDLILSDIQPLQRDDYKIVKQLSAKYPSAPHIVQSSHKSEQEETKCLKTGCSAYISKSYTSSQLIEQIKQMLEN